MLAIDFFQFDLWIYRSQDLLLIFFLAFCYSTKKVQQGLSNNLGLIANDTRTISVPLCLLPHCEFVQNVSLTQFAIRYSLCHAITLAIVLRKNHHHGTPRRSPHHQMLPITATPFARPLISSVRLFVLPAPIYRSTPSSTSSTFHCRRSRWVSPCLTVHTDRST